MKRCIEYVKTTEEQIKNQVEDFKSKAIAMAIHCDNEIKSAATGVVNYIEELKAAQEVRKDNIISADFFKGVIADPSDKEHVRNIAMNFFKSMLDQPSWIK